MKVIVYTGSRKYMGDHIVLDDLQESKPDRVIVGDCPTGLDKIVRLQCRRLHIKFEPVFIADWSKNNSSARPIRNQEMIDETKKLHAQGHQVECHAFKRTDLQNKVTEDCIKKAIKAHIKTIIKDEVGNVITAT